MFDLNFGPESNEKDELIEKFLRNRQSQMENSDVEMRKHDQVLNDMIKHVIKVKMKV